MTRSAVNGRIVWVIDPRAAEPIMRGGRSIPAATVYRHDGTVSILTLDDVLDGEVVLPGFSALLRDLLKPSGG